MFVHRLLVSAIAAAAMASATIPPASAQAFTENSRQHWSIAAGSLEEALSAFAASAGVPLSFEPAQVAGKSSSGLQGNYSVQEGFERLLQGSGLMVAPQANGGYTLKPRPVSTAPEVTLKAVNVTAGSEQESPTGPVKGYVAKRTATGTKTDTPILEIPQSMSVVGRAEMNDRGVTSFTEAARYVPGLHAEQYGGDATGFGWFGLRGFNDTASYLYIDGLRSPNIGYAARINDAYGIERLEVLRGPASVLFGQGDAGGIVNVISKRASADTKNEIALQYGTFEHRQIGLDLGAALDDGQRLHGRLVATHQQAADQDQYPGHGDLMTRHVYIAPTLAWQPTDATSLVLLGMFLDQSSPGGLYEYIGADLKRTGLLMGQPGFGDQSQHQEELGYQFEHHINSAWTFRQNLRTVDSDVDMDALYGPGYDSADPDTGEVRQRAVTNRQNMRYTAVDMQLTGVIEAGGFQHTTLFGVDFMHARFDNRRWRNWGPSLNIYLPPAVQYDQVVTPATAPWQSAFTEQEQVGLYVQDQIRFERWILTLGGRYDRAEDDTHERIDDIQTTVSDEVFSGRAGVSYLFASGLAPYASYTESFLPQSGTDADGNVFEPTRGKQYELGIKYQPQTLDVLLTAALFDLRKTNVPTTDPIDPDYQRQTGEIRSRGLELEGKADLTRQIKLTAQYTYNDVEVTRSNDANLDKHPLNVPDRMASMWMDYSFAGVAQGLSAGLGIRYIGKRYADDVNTVAMPDYTLLDAAIRYQAGPVRLALNVDNLSDKDYVASYAFGYYRGIERTAVLSMSYQF